MLKNVSVDHGNSSVIKYAIPIVLAVVFLIFIGIPAFEISSKIDLCYQRYGRIPGGIKYEYIDLHPIAVLFLFLFLMLTFFLFLFILAECEDDEICYLILIALLIWLSFGIVFTLGYIIGDDVDISEAIPRINSIVFFVSIWIVLVLVTGNTYYPLFIFLFAPHLSAFGLPGIIVKWNYMILILFASIGYAVGKPLGRWMERRIEIREMRERIRREEERRRKEYEQKMKEFELKLKRWKEEGYDVSELEEMLK